MRSGNTDAGGNASLLEDSMELRIHRAIPIELAGRPAPVQCGLYASATSDSTPGD